LIVIESEIWELYRVCKWWRRLSGNMCWSIRFDNTNGLSRTGNGEGWKYIRMLFIETCNWEWKLHLGLRAVVGFVGNWNMMVNGINVGNRNTILKRSLVPQCTSSRNLINPVREWGREILPNIGWPQRGTWRYEGMVHETLGTSSGRRCSDQSLTNPDHIFSYSVSESTVTYQCRRTPGSQPRYKLFAHKVRICEALAR